MINDFTEFSLQPNNPSLRYHTAFSHYNMVINNIENTGSDQGRHYRIVTGGTDHGVRERQFRSLICEVWLS